MKKINKIAAIVCAGAMAVSAFAFAAGCAAGDEDENKEDPKEEVLEDVSLDKLTGVTYEFQGKILNAEDLTAAMSVKQTVKTTDDTTDKKAISYDITSGRDIKALIDQDSRYADSVINGVFKMGNAFNEKNPTVEQTQNMATYARNDKKYSLMNGVLTESETDNPDTNKSEGVFADLLEEADAYNALGNVPGDLIDYLEDTSETVYARISYGLGDEAVCKITDGSFSAKRSDSKLEITVSYKATHEAEKAPEGDLGDSAAMIYSDLDYRAFEVSGEVSYKLDLEAGNKAEDFADPVTTESVADILYLDPTADYSSVASAIKNDEAISIALKGAGAATYKVEAESMPAVSLNSRIGITVYMDYNDDAVKKAMAAGYSEPITVKIDGVEVDGSTIKLAAGWKTAFMTAVEQEMNYRFGEFGYNTVDGFEYDATKVVLKFAQLAVDYEIPNPDFDPTSGDMFTAPNITCSSEIFIKL